MARSSSFGYTNTTDSTKTVTLKQLGEYSNYALTGNSPTKATYKNRTSPLNQPEVVTYSCKPNQVDKAVYPAPSRDGVIYTVRFSDVLRTTDTSDPGFIVDDPIEMWLTVKHGTNNNWSNAQIEEILLRLLGACYDETNSKWRFEDWMRSALTPVND